MALPVEQNNIFKYVEELQSKITSRTGINLFDRTSKTQSIIETLAEQLVNDRREVISGMSGLVISTAVGEQLDKLNVVPRLRETFASVSQYELNLCFYVESGTFGDINGGNSFTIPKNTEIYSDVLENDSGRKISYRTTEDVICLSDEALVYVSAKSEASGSNSNVGPFVLINHGFTNYTSGTGLRVNNFFSIQNGRNQETDAQYRFRITQYFPSIANVNEVKARLASILIPGVVDVKILPGYYGIGTVNVVVLGAELQVNQTMLNAVQNTLNQIALPGMKLIASSAVSCLLDIDLTLKNTRTLSTAEKTRIENLVTRTTRAFLRGLRLGGKINLNDLAIAISSELPSYVRLNSSGGVFDNIWIRRDFAIMNRAERETLSTSIYDLGPEEYADLGTLTIGY